MKRLVEEMGTWYTDASVVRTGGPERIYDADAADPDWKPRHLPAAVVAGHATRDEIRRPRGSA